MRLICRFAAVLTVLFVLYPCCVFSDQSPLVNSSVKLRIDAGNSHSWGTGTIIDTRNGEAGMEALVLTCGHIFRDSQAKGNIEVHLFHNNSSVIVVGACLYYDLQIDLALVTIRPPCPVKAIPIAPENYTIAPSQTVCSVGCDGGGNPTLRTHRIMSLDRIGTPKDKAVPFHYIQVSGAPVSGRSGGGLFSGDGYLIGVCNTADPVENDGQFVPPQMIRYILNLKNLSDVYKNPSLGGNQIAIRQMEPAQQSQPIQQAQSMPPIPQQLAEPTFAEAAPKIAAKRFETQSRSSRQSSQLQPLQPLSHEEKATLDEIKRLKDDGNEVILIVKSRRNPDVPADVIYLNNTSSQFVESLVKNQTEDEKYNPVVFSSQENIPNPQQKRTATETMRKSPVSGQQPVSLSVNHN